MTDKPLVTKSQMINRIAELHEALARKTQECEAKTLEFEGIKKQLDQFKIAKEQAEQKLNKIKDKCNETLEIMNKDSGTNAYAGGRCIEAENILKIIDEVE